MKNNFQRWTTWFPQRWRTQRNAIRNANCRTSWIIKILNAPCDTGTFLVSCRVECSWTPLDLFLSVWLWLCCAERLTALLKWVAMPCACTLRLESKCVLC